MKPFVIDDRLYDDERLRDLHTRLCRLRDNLDKHRFVGPPGIATLDEGLAVLSYFLSEMEDA